MGASCLGGKEDHRGQEASFREGGNQDQEGKEGELWEVVRLCCGGSRSMARLTSTESGRGSPESTGRAHAHGRSVHGWWGTEMLRAETETPRRGTIARFICGCNLINNALSLVVS